MRYATVCSGAEAFGPAWHELGFTPVFHAEIEPHASAVLRYRYPTVPNYGDFTQIATPDGPQPTRPVQLLCGGTPCQTYSVAGLRAGLDSYKGGLTLEFVKLAQRLGASWLLWENVPGVLSSDGGRAFGTFLGTLAECGYGFAYRVLDLQHFGCPQRRKRVFLVAHSGGDWQSCAAVLFESESLRGNPAPRKEPGARTADTLTVGANQYSGFVGEPVEDQHPGTVGTLTTGASKNASYRAGADEAAPGHLITTVITAEGQTGLPCLTASSIGKHANNQQPLCIAFTTEQTPKFNPDQALTLTKQSPTGGGQIQSVMQPAIAFQERGREGGRSVEWQEEQSYALLSPAGGGRGQERNICAAAAVRRLLPVECERLMGWADDWTKYGINAKGKQYELADGPRYRICGNGWGQPVVSWIAQRIKQVDALLAQEAPAI